MYYPLAAASCTWFSTAACLSSALPHILVQVLHPERSPAYVAPFGVEERQTVLAAFAAVSQAQRECMCCNPVL